MKKIISRFYLITIDNKPVYVGYTNRAVKQRFREHIKDKDLPEGTEVKQIDKLEFDFTWDIDKVYENANLVSGRESELILKYKTQDSIYQKGLSDKLGGQTWANIKGFVHNNKDNPKYREMSDQELLEYLDSYRKHVIKLSSFISHYKDPRFTKLNDFVSSYRDYRLDKLYNFIKHYNNDIRLNKLSHFINKYQDYRLNKLANFIIRYHDPRMDKLSSFVGRYQDTRLIKLRNFVNHYNDDNRIQKLSNFVSGYRDPRLGKLHNFITHYKLRVDTQC